MAKDRVRKMNYHRDLRGHQCVELDQADVFEVPEMFSMFRH